MFRFVCGGLALALSLSTTAATADLLRYRYDNAGPFDVNSDPPGLPCAFVNDCDGPEMTFYVDLETDLMPVQPARIVLDLELNMLGSPGSFDISGLNGTSLASGSWSSTAPEWLETWSSYPPYLSATLAFDRYGRVTSWWISEDEEYYTWLSSSASGTDRWRAWNDDDDEWTFLARDLGGWTVNGVPQEEFHLPGTLPVPLPASLPLLLAGAGAMAVLRRPGNGARVGPGTGVRPGTDRSGQQSSLGRRLT